MTKPKQDMKKRYGKNEITREMLGVLNKYKESEISSFDAIILLEPLFKAKEKKINSFYQRDMNENKLYILTWIVLLPLIFVISIIGKIYELFDIEIVI